MQTSSIRRISRWHCALLNVPTIGDSSQTARQDNLPSGVVSSHQMAKTDLSRVLQLSDRFYQVGIKYDVPPALIAALASRESRCGAALDAEGFGDGGHRFGILQVDRRSHNLAGMGDPTSLAHIEQGVARLVSFLRQVRSKHRSWDDELILKGAVAAYNAGVGNIVTKAGIDVGTTGDDYGSDVIARAQFYVDYL